jgi:hypothetical protein
MLLGKAFGRSAQRAALALAVLGSLGGLAAVNTAAGSASTSSPRAANAAALARLYAASSRGLDVIPVPGTPDAPPATPIDFPAVTPAQIATVKAVGSHSGVHPGTLSAQPGNQGTQFAPARRFTPGERVSVTAVLRSASAGAASGAAGSRQLRFSFTIARPASAVTAGVFQSEAAALRASPDTLGMTPSGLAATHASSTTTHSFVTQPHFHPPIIDMVGHDPDGAAGNIFLDVQNSGQNAPYILNRAADLQWYHPTSGGGEGHGPGAFDVRIQNYQGKPYLTYWLGHVNIPPGDGTGVGVMLNEHYQRVHTVTAGAGYQSDGIDLHEFHVEPDGTAFVTVYAPVHADLKSVGGPANGTVYDCIAQQINIATNRVVWEWDAMRHVPLNASYLRYRGGAYDFFHMNSIQELGNGHVLLSARHTWAVYSINKKTGKIDWVLGGRHSTFFRDAGSHVFWQHDAEMHNNGLLTVFDNGSNGGSPNENQSRAVAIHLNFATKHATLVHAYLHSPSVLAASMGENQLLFNKNVFVGWGAAPTFSEYSPSGAQLYKAWFRSPVDSYRGYRFASFVGQPTGPPAIAVRNSSHSGSVNVYASWNGSTLIRRWRLLAGSTSGSLHQVATKSWNAFETTIQAAKANFFEVQALDAHGNVLPHGTSAAVHG